jgi:glucose-6-phosphate isomerase
MIDLLQKYNIELKSKSLSQLLAEPGRFDRYSARLGGVLLDYSRVHIDDVSLDRLLDWAQEAGVEAARDRLFAGAQVNLTEHRPALHMLLRGECMPKDEEPADAARAIAAIDDMLDVAAALHQGHLPGDEDAHITDIVHIGIGGSLLGTQLLHEALGRHDPSVPRVHFLGSVDAHARSVLLPRLKPESTVMVAASKSFTTGDTLLHARRVRQWLADSLDDEQVSRRMFAVTAADARAAEFGIPQEQVFYLPEWVGGRYSLWSPVSLSAAATMGAEPFRELLAGAADMDRHFREADLRSNLPVLMGLVGAWHRNVCGYGAWAVFSYDHRLRLLHSHLQQVIMESNGKSVTTEGMPSPLATSPVVFGESGTEAQHSVFQALHQGTDVVPINFVGVVRPAHEDREAHAELLANMLAQATALACGRSSQETLEQMRKKNVSDAEALLPHRTFAGNRPSEIIMLDELTPANLGRLLALYEHKVFVESVLWSINAFDQWGVELGKQLAPGVQSGLAGEAVDLPGLDGLLKHIRSLS